MVPLECNLNLSWKSQLICGVFYALLIVVILLLPWPEQDWPIWLLLVILIAVESILAQRRIRKTTGLLTVFDKNSVYWAGEKWMITGVPFAISFGICLFLESEFSGKKTHLWIAIDSVSRPQWRSLRYELLQNRP